MKLAAALIVLAILAAAILSSHQHKPFLLLVDEAEASTIICNPVLVPGIPKAKRINRT